MNSSILYKVIEVREQDIKAYRAYNILILSNLWRKIKWKNHATNFIAY